MALFHYQYKYTSNTLTSEQNSRHCMNDIFNEFPKLDLFD